jgi:GNAT superfamily N-acetyltransferase
LERTVIVEYPLTKNNRINLARAFRNVPRVDISIECVLEAHMGKAFVDNAESPSAYKIMIGPFFYFAGNAHGAGGQEMLKEIKPYTLFMSSSTGWAEECRQLYGERLVAFERYSFSSEKLSLEQLTRLCKNSAHDIKRMDIAMLEKVWGQDHFIEISDFDSVSDFIGRGIGYYAEKNGEVIGAAYSSLVCNQGIEISLFVSDDYRRQGIATALSANLVRWCLENNMDAHWDAANLESCKLAEKLGYIPVGGYQAYYLKP